MVVEKEGNCHVLEKKPTKWAISKVIKKIAGWTRPDLTFETSILAFIRLFLYNKDPLFLCDESLTSQWKLQKVKDLEVILDNPAGVRKILANNWM